MPARRVLMLVLAGLGGVLLLALIWAHLSFPSDHTPEGAYLRVVIAVNAQTADGTDPSWLWDVPMEKLRGRQVVASGERAADLAVRLHYADVEHTIEADPALALASLPAGSCDLVANYTAFVRARATLDGGAA